MDFSLELPINRLSFGQVSYCILREFFKLGINPDIFPISEVDVVPYDIQPDFKEWLEYCINNSVVKFRRENPVFRLWHLNGSHHSVSNKQLLYTFYEANEPTPVELNIIQNNAKVLFSSRYSQRIFEDYGARNVGFLPLGFDSESFKQLSITNDGNRIIFGLAGKLEKRKNHFRVLNLWAKKYGNNKNYLLNCSLFNTFLSPEIQQNLINKALEGKNYWNINFLPYMEQNSVYSNYLNNNDAIIDMSSSEGWSVPSFSSVCLGKHALVLNATGIKEWATTENSVLVNPNGKIPLYDGVFFQKGQPFNQGSGYDFSDNAFYEGMEKLIKKIQKDPINHAGLKLQEKFTYAKTVNQILKELEGLK